jgi:hypothetical protein
MCGYEAFGMAHGLSLEAADWTTGDSKFDSRHGSDFCLLKSIRTGPKAHPASYPTGIEGKVVAGMKLTASAYCRV